MHCNIWAVIHATDHPALCKKTQNNVEYQSWESKVCKKVYSQAAGQQPSVKIVVSCSVGLSIMLLNLNILEVFSFCSA